jgi:hypothetical protein
MFARRGFLQRSGILDAESHGVMAVVCSCMPPWCTIRGQREARDEEKIPNFVGGCGDDWIVRDGFYG